MELTEEMIERLPVITKAEMEDFQYSPDEFVNDVLKGVKSIMEEIER